MTYWDTSCVLKLYAPEPRSAAYLSLAESQRGPLACSEVAMVELSYAFHRKEKDGSLVLGASEALLRQVQRDIDGGRFALLPFGRDVLSAAMKLASRCYEHEPMIPLRSMDGIHLATALVAKAKRLVTADLRMRAAAEVIGLRLIDPVSRWPR